MKAVQKLVACLAAAAVMGVAMADATSDFRKWYVAGMPKMKRAFKKNDIKFFEKMAAPTFKYKEADGKVQGRKEALAGLKQMFAMTPGGTDVDMKIEAIKVKGNTATVVGRSTYTSVTKDPSGKPRKMVMKGYDRETWVRSGKGWLMVMIEELKKGTMTMDGKPFDPSKMGGGG